MIKAGIYAYNSIVSHHFTEITLKSNENREIIWLIQIDEAGIKQWIGSKAFDKMEGYKYLTRWPNTIRPGKNSIEDESLKKLNPVAIHDWVLV